MGLGELSGAQIRDMETITDLVNVANELAKGRNATDIDYAVCKPICAAAPNAIKSYKRGAFGDGPHFCA